MLRKHSPNHAQIGILSCEGPTQRITSESKRESYWNLVGICLSQWTFWISQSWSFISAQRLFQNSIIKNCNSLTSIDQSIELQIVSNRMCLFVRNHLHMIFWNYQMTYFLLILLINMDFHCWLFFGSQTIVFC